ncbi:hypothetical protein OIDMADRAFT_182893 [Oidiodendron maius Zn]|uniref:Zn(2)-C6 fungal-type domain-containing protein n=1 Tax=Oidiodendron maius (strain Zn) TaxID=913774 RepID=A0A0C3GKL2_OIDMZ|nr:hypothetical protein OIDMADRAFT_182893 [Oidiodendron maius Zn]
MSQTSEPSGQSKPSENAKLARVACDQCHRCKLRCTRELPRCERCSHLGSPCTFSTGKPIGKPRGRKNKNPRISIANLRDKQDQTGSIITLDVTQPKQPPSFIANESSQTIVGSPGIDVAKSSASGNNQALLGHDVEPHDPFRHYPPEAISSVQSLSPSKDLVVETKTLLDFQHPSGSISITADLAEASCACSPSGFYMFSVLHQAHQSQPSLQLDQSLSMARRGVLTCQRTLNCNTCCNNAGMLLLLPLMYSVLSHYHKLLFGRIPPSPKMANSSPEFPITCTNTKAGAVLMGGLEVNGDLQERIIHAIIRSEIQAGMRVFIAFEQALMGEVNNSMDPNVCMALRQLSLALIEQFKSIVLR